MSFRNFSISIVPVIFFCGSMSGLIASDERLGVRGLIKKSVVTAVGNQLTKKIEEKIEDKFPPRSSNKKDPVVVNVKEETSTLRHRTVGASTAQKIDLSQIILQLKSFNRAGESQGFDLEGYESFVARSSFLEKEVESSCAQCVKDTGMFCIDLLPQEYSRQIKKNIAKAKCQAKIKTVEAQIKASLSGCMER